LRTKEDLLSNLKSESTEIKNYINTTKDEIFKDRGNV